MGRNNTGRNPQLATDETLIEDAELEKALNDRETAKGRKVEATNKFKAIDQAVKDKLGEHGIEEGDAVRVGDFRIARIAVAPKEVEFSTAKTTRLNITRDEEA